MAFPGDFDRWFDDALAAQAEVPFAVVVGRRARSARRATSNCRARARRVEIGWTWLRRSAWGTGANVETKLLLLEHAFERHGLQRVEFKTDARNERTRGALLALGAQFEGIFRKHMILPDGPARLGVVRGRRGRLAGGEGRVLRRDRREARGVAASKRPVPRCRELPAKGDREARRYLGCGCCQA